MFRLVCLNAPTGAWCSLTCFSAWPHGPHMSLNAPTGAWCSLTLIYLSQKDRLKRSQCTYRCVVLPDSDDWN